MVANPAAVNDPAKAQAERFKRRVADLIASDPQIRAAESLPAVNEAKTRAGLPIARVIQAALEGYAERPAMGRRARTIVADPASGRKSARPAQAFQTVTYRELGARVRALAAAWHGDEALAVRPGELVCILAFAGPDFVVVDLATTHSGIVSVPLQSNASAAQLAPIVAEAEPRCVAASLECLGTAVDAILAGHHPRSLVVFDYEPRDDDQREAFERARARLAQAGSQTLLCTLDEVLARGAALAAPPPFESPPGGNPLSTIYYTSGSTGLPKGAMYPEKMTRVRWVDIAPVPLVTMHYQPMNHAMGRSVVWYTLGSGGTVYFAGASDLSTLFDDIADVRPTQINLVPRLCEMIQHRWQAELDRRLAAGADRAGIEPALMEDFRRRVLGGRLLSSSFGSAPMSQELRVFIETLLDYKLADGYGTTETSGIAVNGYVRKPPIIDYKLVDVPELGYFTTDKPHPRGELLVKTQTVMAGYYKRPELTAAVFDADGYYRTGDIMAEIGPDRIAYVDRRNNVLKLAQGEFVAIARLEAIFNSRHPLIAQTWLYGTSDRDFLLGVFVPRMEVAERMGGTGDPGRLKALLREAIKQVAQQERLQPYEVPRDFIVETEPFSVENGLLAGVGKYLRPAFKARYGAAMERLYAEIEATRNAERGALLAAGRDAPVLQTLARAVEATLGIAGVDPDKRASFAELGGDSLSALEFSMLLEEIYGVEVPVGVITHPTGSLAQLTQFIDRARAERAGRPTFNALHGSGALEIHARDLTLDRFIDADTLARASTLAPPHAGEPRTVLLTGANGFLGRFLCMAWLERLARSGGRLVCIARGVDDASARQRIAEALDSGDADLRSRFEALAAGRLEVLAGDIGEPRLGLREADWDRLAAEVDLIVHPAALVNHVLPYAQLFGPNVAGTAELIRLAISTRLKRFNDVSTIAVAGGGAGRVDEDADIRLARPSRRVDDAGYATGYASSKWAAEVLLRDAHTRFGLPIAVFRSGMILPHTRYAGQFNAPDIFSRWLFSLVVTGIAPRSFYRASQDGRRTHYEGLSVDFIADAIVGIGQRAITGFATYHVVNPHDDGVALDTFVDWAIEAGQPIRRIDDYADWRLRFETALRALPERQRQQSSLALLHQLREPAPVSDPAAVSAQRFESAVRELGLGEAGVIPHLSAGFIRKYLDDLRHVGMI
ncbi:MAG: carboxylic acid reductase [Gammaproteobacteria bacterium]